MTDRSVVVRLRAEIEGFKRGMREAQASVKAVGDESKKTSTTATTASERMVQSATKNKDAWEKSGRAMLLTGAALGAGIAITVKTFADFDAQMSQVKTLSHATAGEMAQLTNAALTMGQGIGFSAKQTAEAETELVKAGLSVKDIMGGALHGALVLAAAGQLDVGRATEIAASAMTQFKLSGKDVPHIADLLAAGADKALGSVGDLGSALSSSGTVAHQFGWSLEETVGTLAEFAQNSQIGEKGGTLLRQMFLQLVNPSKQAKAYMDQYGFSLYDASGKMVSSSELAGRLQKSFGGLAKSTQNTALATIFGAHAIQGATILMGDGAKVNADWVKSVNASGFAAQQAAGKMDNLNGDLAKLRAALENDLIKTGSGANNTLRGMTQAVTAVARVYGAVPAPIQSAGLAIAGVTAATLLLGGALLSIVPRIITAKTRLTELGVSAERTSLLLKGIGGAGIVLAVAEVGEGLMQVGARANVADVSVKTLAGSLNSIASGSKQAGSFGDLFDTGAKWSPFRHEVTSTSEALKAFSATATGALGHRQADLWDRFLGDSGRLATFNKQVGEIDASMAQMVQSGNIDGAAKMYDQLMGSIAAANKAGAQIPVKQVADKFSAYHKALADAVVVTGTYKNAAGAVVPITQSMADAMLLLGPSAKASDQAVQDLAAGLDAYQGKVSKAFQSSTDVLTTFTGTTSKQLAASYRSTLKMAGQFSSDISTATRRGLDPAIISRLLEAGPKAAGPALRAMVSDHSGRLIKMANASEAALGKIQARVLDESRLTNMALQSGTDTMVRDLAAAMKISEAEASSGGKATADALARQLHIGAAEVKRIASEFGISIATGVGGGANRAGIAVSGLGAKVNALPNSKSITFSVPGLRSSASSVAAFVNQLANMPTQKKVQILYSTPASHPGPGIATVHPASGGLITGPGTGTSDSIPAMVSNGEYVINAASTAKHLDLLRSINADRYAEGGFVGRMQSVPRFADGGRVGMAASGPTTTINKTYNVYGHDAADGVREARMAERHADALSPIAYG